MNKPLYTQNDDLLVKAIKEGDKTALNFLYKKFYTVAQRLVLQNSGDEDDAADLYQEAILILYEKINSSNFNLSCSLKTYIYSICRNKWLYKLRQKAGNTPMRFDDVEDFIELADSTLGTTEEDLAYDAVLQEALNKIDETCKNLLLLFYYDKLSLEIIAEKLGYNNAKTAKAKKNKCMNRVRAIAQALLDKFDN